jgi:hypothetical protein
LVLGKEPSAANSASIKPYLGYMNFSPFAAHFSNTLQLAERAAAMQQITSPVVPGAFVAWAERYDYVVPAELKEGWPDTANT